MARVRGEKQGAARSRRLHQTQGGQQMKDTRITQYGFVMGPCEVIRICSDLKWGSLIDVQGKRQRIEIKQPHDFKTDIWSLGILFYVIYK